jgi:membrane peptidoglycan carboxypeptidase
MKYNWKHKKIALGASTISQQTAKNMFLSLSRNPMRKFQELLLTFLLEAKLSKAQILHVYLNIAEFGPGIYGIEAAARNYYHTSAYNLSTMQAGELAASLPSPKKHNPRTRTRFFKRHVSRLSRALRIADQFADQSKVRNGKSEAEISAELAQKLQQLRELNADDSEGSAKADSDELTDAEAETANPVPTAAASAGQDSPAGVFPTETGTEPAAASPTADDTALPGPPPAANLPLLE